MEAITAGRSAVSEPARKDFAPASTKGGYSFPYQHNPAEAEMGHPVDDQTPQTNSIAFPIDTAINDFADSFVFLSAGVNKIENAIKHNQSLNSQQKKELREMRTFSKKVLKAIKNLGCKLEDVASLKD